MANAIGRILLMLASADVSRDELKAFGRWLNSAEPDALVRRVQELRGVAGHDNTLPSRSTVPEQTSNPLRENVEELLVTNSGLKRVEAATLLRELMIRDGKLDSSFLPWNSGSFGQWLNKVAKMSSESELLHYASRISRDRGKSQPSAWPLKSSDEDA